VKLGLGVLAQIPRRVSGEGFLLQLPVADIALARGGAAQIGDRDGAVELSRAVVDDVLESGLWMFFALAPSATHLCVLADALLQRGPKKKILRSSSFRTRKSAIDRLHVPPDPGFFMTPFGCSAAALFGPCCWRRGCYRDYRDRYTNKQLPNQETKTTKKTQNRRWRTRWL